MMAIIIVCVLFVLTNVANVLLRRKGELIDHAPPPGWWGWPVLMLAVVYLTEIVPASGAVRGAFLGVAAGGGCEIVENLYSIWYRFRSRTRVSARR